MKALWLALHEGGSMRSNTDAESRPIIDADDNQIFIDILHFNGVTVDVVEVEAARESLVIGSVWGMARERMQDNDEEKLQNTGSPALLMKLAA